MMVSAISTIGFVGLGSMGGPIARNLLRAGSPLIVLDRLRERVTLLVEEGAPRSGRSSRGR